MKRDTDVQGPRPATLAAQALGRVEPAMRSVVPPIWTSASYERAPDGSYPGGHSYTRDQSPGYDQPEALLARLEGGADALLFASGMAAGATVLDTLDDGAHVVAPESMYWTLRLWLRRLAERGRLDVEFVPTGDLDALRAALRPGETRLVWLESPANPLCEITDLAAAAELSHAAGALVAADSTLATPVLTRPLELGVDLVMHSATKQLNGHADVVAGALVTARCDATWEAIRHERAYRGAILGPFEAWLLLRGMRTLFLRVERSASNAQRVAEMLAAHPAVGAVHYPGLPQHPGHALAARQMQGGFGPVVSFRVGGDEAGARAVAARLQLFRDATSLGGAESLVEHRASVEGRGTPLPPDLLRLSIGIEDADDLVTDLRRALDA
ncbi:MAG: aminotransferase class I/II-fold pyridoxal phosphate-dependent enzyme [Myxococcota bacterium]|nr:aminotransferase class I/II-fold pyridoxal phosphate-dependent enzyme [Myxococcota bacterium]